MEITCEMNECPICYESMIELEQLTCGHNICDCCSNRWFVRSNTCPMCRAPVRPAINVVEDDITNIINVYRNVISDDDIARNDMSDDTIIRTMNDIFNQIDTEHDRTNDDIPDDQIHNIINMIDKSFHRFF